MKRWFLIGIISAIAAFLLSLLIFSNFKYNPAYSIFGNLILGVRLFYALIFVCISFFIGIIVGALSEKSFDMIDYYSKLYIIIINGMAFFLVLGFGFSLQVWQFSFNNIFTWLSILAFLIVGVIIVFFVYLFARNKIKPKIRISRV